MPAQCMDLNAMTMMVHSTCMLCIQAGAACTSCARNMLAVYAPNASCVAFTLHRTNADTSTQMSLNTHGLMAGPHDLRHHHASMQDQ